MARVTLDKLYDAALQAICYVSMANYRERAEAAEEFLARVRSGKFDMTIEQVDQALQEGQEH